MVGGHKCDKLRAAHFTHLLYLLQSLLEGFAGHTATAVTVTEVEATEAGCLLLFTLLAFSEPYTISYAIVCVLLRARLAVCVRAH